ncbi:hypothetical protein Aperf_G00000124746 [Anoplocephala perfoliata]
MEKTASRMYGGLLPPGIIGSFGGFMGTPPPSAPSNFYDLSALQHHQQQQQRLLHHHQQRPSSNSATSTSSTSGSSVTPSTTSASASGGIGSTGGGNPAVDALSPCSTSSASALHSELFNAARLLMDKISITAPPLVKPLIKAELTSVNLFLLPNNSLRSHCQ